MIFVFHLPPPFFVHYDVTWCQVACVGQMIGVILGETAELAKRAPELVNVQYEELPVIMTIDDAIAANRNIVGGWVGPVHSAMLLYSREWIIIGALNTNSPLPRSLLPYISFSFSFLKTYW